MKKSRLVLILILIFGIALITVPILWPNVQTGKMNWGLIATIFAVLVIGAVFFEFESKALSSKEIALIAMLGTISAVLRIPFVALPSVQPCSYLIICTGYVFGPVAGFMVGALTVLVSNFFIGLHGPYTPYQMLAWGLLGVIAAYLRRFNLGKIHLIILGIVGAYLYGWIVNLWGWTTFIYPLTLKTFIVYQSNSVWFDTFHAIGNAVFLGLFGMKTIKILERFKKRFNWTLVPLT